MRARLPFNKQSLIFLTVITAFAVSGSLVFAVENARPNIVVIMTDDQDDINSLSAMTKVNNLLAAKGIRFTNSFVDFPLCCPSRATFLTGQSARNSGILGNTPGTNGGYGKLHPTAGNTLPVWLQNAGYFTAHVGKYLNGYGREVSGTVKPPGWNTWRALVENLSGYTYTYNNFKISEDGVIKSYTTYQTDFLTDQAVNIINSRASDETPFFLNVWYWAPHSSGEASVSGVPIPVPAPRHNGLMANEPFPKPPSYNEADVSDKPRFFKEMILMDAAKQDATAKSYRARRESLLAVDEGVEKIVNALISAGKLSNTIIVFTSDNGFFHGEHRKTYDKLWAYDEATRVPLIITGPGIPNGQTRSQIVTNVDLAPTILEWAGAVPGRVMDGKSLVSVVNNSSTPWRTGFLVRGWDETPAAGDGDRFAAVRTNRYLYVEHNNTAGEKELYDMVVDPYQITSKHNNSAYASVKSDLASKLTILRSCAGNSCFVTSPEPPPPGPDTIPPVISAVSASSITSNGATINWNTNEPATRQVEYGLTTTYGSQTTENTVLATSHTVALSALTPFTTYHYRVKSKDAAGNLATSPDYSFTTASGIAGSRPNIVVIMTDDMDYTTDSIQVMAKVKSLLANKGVTFTNSFVDNPLCCPSRASFLTGQNSHNSGVFTNLPPDGGYGKLIPTETNTLPVWMQNAGYNTAHIGKYLNGYGVEAPETKVPPGWSTWFGLVDPSTYYYYNYTVNNNGVLRTYGSTPADYQTDVLAQKAVDFINQQAESTEPFFLWLAPVASHTGRPSITAPEPAPRHKGVYSAVPLPRPPSFNEADLSDKPAFMAKERPLLGATDIADITQRFRRVRETLLGVDDMVEKVVNTLQSTGKLDNTIIIFTSDNGFFYGEHRNPLGKRLVYEEAIRVPLIVKGPGIPQGQTRSQLVNNLDLPATIIELAKATPRRALDGRSLMPLLQDAAVPWRAALLVQGSDKLRDTEGLYGRYKAIRTNRYKYVEHRNLDETLFAKELYDLSLDPYELTSKHNDSSYASVLSDLTSKLAVLKTCSGLSCWVTSPEPPPTLAFSASPVSVVSGYSATLTWSSTDATSCIASGAWSGTRPLSGSENTGLLTASKTYTLTCTGAGGSMAKSVTVSVRADTATVTNSIALQPSSPSVLLGNEIRVDIVANNISDLIGIQASVSYNPAVLRYERAQDGAFLKQGGAQTLFLDTIDTTTSGIIKNIAVVRIGSGASGSGTIASIYLRATNRGVSDLRLSQVMLASSNGTAISTTALNASVNVVFSDADSDGVPDSLDRCPHTPPQYAVGRHGCPIPPGNFSPDLSTNLSDVDLSDLMFFRIGIRDIGELDFGSKSISLLENISGILVPVNLSRVIEFSRNKIIVRSELFRAFNTSATVTLVLAGIANPSIYRNSFTCSDCRITGFAGGNLTFTVPHFTEYSVQDGSYCGDNFCSSLESCSLCSIDCGVCQTPIVSGGDGDSSTKTFENITVSYPHFDIFRVFIDFTSRKTVSDQNTLSLDASEITAITSLPEGPVVYKAFNIMPVNFTSSEVQLAKIEFRVDKNWIKANNIDVDSIKLYRLAGTSWTPTYTVRIDETSYAYHFLAETTGFSIFAIGGFISAEPPEEPVQPPQEQMPVQAPPQTPAQASSDMLGLVIIIAGVVVLIIVISKLKGRHKKEETVSNPFLRPDSSG